MVTYTCPRCNYTTNHRTKFTRHQNRKNKCEIAPENKTRYDLGHDIPQGNPGGNPGGNPDYPKKVIRKVIREHPHFPKNEDKISSFLTKTTSKSSDKYECRYCGEVFTKKQNRWRHEKYRCSKNKNKLLNKKSIINEQDITMKLLSYNNTNRNFITDDMISVCMQKENRCVPEIIKLVHFNNKYPENNNILIRDMQRGQILTYNGKEWVLSYENNMMEKLIYDNEKFIHTKFLEWYDDSSKKEKYKVAIDKFKQYLEKSTNQELINSIKKELKDLCYNIKNKVDIKNSGYIVTEVIE